MGEVPHEANRQRWICWESDTAGLEVEAVHSMFCSFRCFVKVWEVVLMLFVATGFRGAGSGIYAGGNAERPILEIHHWQHRQGVLWILLLTRASSLKVCGSCRICFDWVDKRTLPSGLDLCQQLLVAVCAGTL